MEAPINLARQCLTWNGAAVGQAILRQVPRGHRRAARVAMLHAAQELFLTTFWKREPPPELIWKRNVVEWRFEAVSYIYVPKPDDRIFQLYATARRRGKSVVLLVPPSCGKLVREAFKRQRRRDYFSSFTIDDYLAWRTMFAGAHARWAKKRVILWWLSRYNRFVRRNGLPRSLIVRLECPPSARESWRR